MKFVKTIYLPANTTVNLANTRIYKTTCEDKHFLEIIDANKELLGGEYVITNILYVLMENENIEDTNQFYASITIQEEWKGDEVSYYPNVITCEKLLSWEVCLKYLLEQAIENLSSENSYISFDKEHKENVRIIGNEEDVVLKILTSISSHTSF
jgi:hypothetical protein